MPKLLLVQEPSMSYLGRRRPEIYGKTSAPQHRSAENKVTRGN